MQILCLGSEDDEDGNDEDDEDENENLSDGTIEMITGMRRGRGNDERKPVD